MNLRRVVAIALVLAAATVPCGFALADDGTQTVAEHRAPQAVKPSAPRAPAIVAGSASILLTWRAPADDGGSAVYQYVVQRSLDGVNDWHSVATVTTPTFTNRNLTNGVRYHFRVKAYNAVGYGPYSPIVSAVPRLQPPLAASGVRTLAGDGSVTVTWQPPFSDGGRPIDMYLVQRSPSGSSGWVNLSTTPLTTLDATWLTNGTRYYFRVRARSSLGWGAYSAVVSEIPGSELTVPREFRVIPRDRSIDLTWSSPAFDGGSSIDYYVVQRSLDQVTWRSLPLVTSGTSWTDPNLTNGTRYYYRVRAQTAAGYGPMTRVLSAVPLAPPGAPRDPRATPFDGAAQIGWVYPDGTAWPEDVVSYRVEQSTDQATWVTVATVDCCSGDPVVRGLTNGTTYYFRVLASNSAGFGPPSDVVSVTPVAPVALVGTTTATSTTMTTSTTTTTMTTTTTTGPTPVPVESSSTSTSAAPTSVEETSTVSEPP